jgi:hypothetical protein
MYRRIAGILMYRRITVINGVSSLADRNTPVDEICF